MKKFLFSLLLIFPFLLCGCELADNPFITTEDQNKSSSKENNSKGGIPAKFNKYQLNYTDDEGFSFKVICRISPWILQSNTKVINATWDSIAKGKELPTINSWGFQKDGDFYSYSEYYTTSFNSKIDDMYYAVGTIEITNITEGFSFSADKAGYPRVQIIKNALVDYEDKLITKIYFGNEEVTSAIGIVINAKMTSNTWGPVPFVIAYAEHFTPNNPNGENYEKILTLPLYLCHAESSNSDSVTINLDRL